MLIGRIPSYYAVRLPERIAVIDGPRRVTYRLLADRVCRLANAFAGLGLRPRDTAAILIRNSLEFIETLFACAKLGVTVVPLNYRLSSGELVFALNDCKARLLVVAAEFSAAIDERRHELDYLRTTVEVGGLSLSSAVDYETVLSKAASSEPSDVNIWARDCQLILYTSGTTGFPKGAMLSHANLFWNSYNVRSYYPCGPGDACLVALPLYHTAGLNFSALPFLHAGATVVLQAVYDVEETIALLAREACSQTILLPQMWEDISRLDIEKKGVRLRQMVCGGGPTDPGAVERLCEATGGEYSLIMGMTEVGPLLCHLPPHEVIRKNGAIGRPILTADVRVVDDDFVDVVPGQAGEIVTRGPGVFAGYWSRAEETAKAFTGEWFHSGDYARIDEEEFLTIVDRKKDMIRSGGENVYSLEVENILAAHPDIAEVAVVGAPDRQWGESVVAFVVARPRCGLTTQEVVEWCRSHLASYKKPKSVIFADSLPRNATGKVLKRELRQRCASVFTSET